MTQYTLRMNGKSGWAEVSASGVDNYTGELLLVPEKAVSQMRRYIDGHHQREDVKLVVMRNDGSVMSTDTFHGIWDCACGTLNLPTCTVCLGCNSPWSRVFPKDSCGSWSYDGRGKWHFHKSLMEIWGWVSATISANGQVTSFSVWKGDRSGTIELQGARTLAEDKERLEAVYRK